METFGFQPKILESTGTMEIPLLNLLQRMDLLQIRYKAFLKMIRGSFGLAPGQGSACMMETPFSM